MKITKDMTIQQVLEADRRTAAVFMRHGMFCIGCPAATNENIEQAAMVHGINLDALITDLNSVFESQE